MKRAALGFRVHTGWAALVATAGPAKLPVVLERRRVEMIAGHDSKAPPYVYHAAANLTLESAQRLVQEQATLAGERARAALIDVVGELQQRGYKVVGAGIIGGNRTLTLPLENILASHALIHAAEGQLFRGAIGGACEKARIPVITIAAKELYARAVKDLGGSTESIRQALTEAGRAVGKPWTQDQKESLLVGLLALQTK